MRRTPRTPAEINTAISPETIEAGSGTEAPMMVTVPDVLV
jgi:hypothetical protein